MRTKSWSVFEIKSVDESERIIQGIASTPSVDRVGDEVMPEGAQFSLPIPLLLGHDSSRPVGAVIRAQPNEREIPVTVKIARSDEPGTLKDRLDEAWQSVKLRLIRGLSIGFIPLETSRTKTGLKFIRWSWIELSLVVVPANEQATITSVKSFDESAYRAYRQRRKERPVVVFGPGRVVQYRDPS